MNDLMNQCPLCGKPLEVRVFGLAQCSGEDHFTIRQDLLESLCDRFMAGELTGPEWAKQLFAGNTVSNGK